SVKSGNRAAVPSKPRVETKGIWRRIELCLNFIHAIVPVWGYSHPARLRECRNPGTGSRQIILEMRHGTAQGWRRKEEQMGLAHNRTLGPRSRRHKNGGSFGAIRFPWLVLLASCLAASSWAAELYVRQSDWVETMLTSRAALARLSGPERTR